MKIRQLVLATLVFVFAGITSTSYATTVTVNTQLDVNDIVAGLGGFTGGVQGSPPFSPPFSVQLSAGDIFDYTISFAPGQQLTINNPTSFWAFSYADVVSDVTGTGSLSLLDSTGAALYTSILKTDTEGVVHFGQFFSNLDFPSLPTSVTFSGLHYVGTLDSYADPLVTIRTYDTPAFFFNADNPTNAPVPEPSTMLLLGVGMFGLAVYGKRRAGKRTA